MSCSLSLSLCLSLGLSPLVSAGRWCLAACEHSGPHPIPSLRSLRPGGGQTVSVQSSVCQYLWKQWAFRADWTHRDSAAQRLLRCCERVLTGFESLTVKPVCRCAVCSWSGDCYKGNRHVRPHPVGPSKGAQQSDWLLHRPVCEGVQRLDVSQSQTSQEYQVCLKSTAVDWKTASVF